VIPLKVESLLEKQTMIAVPSGIFHFANFRGSENRRLHLEINLRALNKFVMEGTFKMERSMT